MPMIISPVNSAQDDVPLLTKAEKDEDRFSSSETVGEWGEATNRRSRDTLPLFTSLGLNVILLLGVAYLLAKQANSIEWKGARPVYTPARDAVVHELVKFSSVGHAKTPYDGPPSDEVDAAWKDLYAAGISAIPKASAALLPNRTEPYTGDEQHYIVELDLFHQLHCLNLVRRAIWPEHYPQAAKDRFSPLANGGVFDHVDHCLNAVRESLMCNADLTPVTWHWNERDQVSTFDFDAIHTCVSWDSVHEWTAENTARVKFDRTHHVVDDLVFPDDLKA